MVGYLECSGPNHFTSNQNNTPAWSICTRSNLKPCPFCRTLCSNPLVSTEEKPGHCKNSACKCCFKSSKAEVKEGVNSCQCCGRQLANKDNESCPNQGFRCPCFEKVLNNKGLIDTQPNIHGFDHPVFNQMHYSVCPRYSNFNCRYCFNNRCSTTSARDMAPCENGWCFPCNMHLLYAGCCCQNTNEPVKPNVLDKMVECKPRKSVILIGGKLINCYHGKRNGLQDADECGLANS